MRSTDLHYRFKPEQMQQPGEYTEQMTELLEARSTKEIEGVGQDGVVYNDYGEPIRRVFLDTKDPLVVVKMKVGVEMKTPKHNRSGAPPWGARCGSSFKTEELKPYLLIYLLVPTSEPRFSDAQRIQSQKIRPCSRPRLPRPQQTFLFSYL